MKITWNLRMLCAQKGIWTGAELGRRLRAALGLSITAQTLSALFTGQPRNLSLNMLLALCATLECGPNDLLLVDTSASRRTSVSPLQAT
jgi:putative transcriptional regulator